MTDQLSTHIFSVNKEDSGIRLDRFLARHLHASGISREKVKRLILSGNVTVNEAPALSPKEIVYTHTVVAACVRTRATSLTPEEGGLAVLYRDASLAILDKPAGLTVHPAPSCPTGTLVHRLVRHFPELAEQEGFRPGIVHRLDKDTSGLLLVALTEHCRLALSAAFARHAIFKEYLTLVPGTPVPSQGVIEAPMGRHPENRVKMAVTPGGKPAKSAWRTLHADPHGRFSLLAVRIFSGRTHQVRVHMRHLGHPILGDALYGFKNSPPATGTEHAHVPFQARQNAVPPRQMLHAWKLAFAYPLPPDDRMTGSPSPPVRPEPFSAAGQRGESAPSCTPEHGHGTPALPHGFAHAGGVLRVTCPPPEDFSAAVRLLARRTLPVVITGSPGCGKSSLLSLLREAGVPVFSADAEVKAQYQKGGDGWTMLRARFGERFVPDADGPVDKAALGAAMRQNPDLRREVEGMLHPLVRHARDAFWATNAAAGAALAAAEIPLYLETESGAPRPDPPLLVGVHCPFESRRKRLAANRGWDAGTIADIEAWQWPEEKKMRACALVINNTGDLAELAGEARRLTEQLHALREKREQEVLRRMRDLWNDQSFPDMQKEFFAPGKG